MVKKKPEVLTKDKDFKFREKNNPEKRVEKEMPGESGKLSGR